MEIRLQDLLQFVSTAVDAGVQSYIRSVEPGLDRIKQSEAKRYVSRAGFQPAVLSKWVDARLLTPVKSGDAQNSAVWYSLADIKRVISAIRLKRISDEDLRITKMKIRINHERVFNSSSWRNDR